MQLIIKNKFSLSLFLTVLVIGLYAIGINHAYAVGNAYFPQATTVTLGVGDFTITAGSDADTVVTTGTNITVTISTGQTFTLQSSDRKLLENDSTSIYTYSCDSDKSTITLTSTTTRTVIITPSATACGTPGSSGGGGGGGAGTTTSTPTPTPSVSATPTPTVTPTPTSTPLSVGIMTPSSRGFVSLVALSLKEGDVVSSPGSSDPDVYIPNVWGYKRLFLNPVIFNFYGHLGGFRKVKNVASTIRDKMVTSGLFRNCETNDQKVYGVETTGEDTGMLHWVNTTGAQAVKDDPDFFKKVFCINSNEFNWYKKGTAYTSVNQIPVYTRK